MSNYNNQMMNIQMPEDGRIKYNLDEQPNMTDVIAYKFGHRDARHAAAKSSHRSPGRCAQSGGRENAMAMNWQEEVFEMRPPDNVFDVFRYNGGLWIPDDGEWDLAFCAPHQVTVWYVRLPYYTNLQWQFLTAHWSGHVAGHPYGGNAWHCITADNKPTSKETRWNHRSHHPNIVAGDEGMSHVAGLMRSSSGVGASFQTHDPFVQARKIRLKKTGEIVVPPSGHCIYCGCDVSKGLTSL